jgi:uncharacterized membrane protein
MEKLVQAINMFSASGEPIHINIVKVPLIALAALLIVWLVADRRSGDRLADWSAKIQAANPQAHRRFAFTLISLWTVFLCYLKVQQHICFQTGIDLAIYENVAWHITHGPIFYESFFNGNVLGAHFSPIHLMIGVVYRIYEDPTTLLVLQSVGLGAGGAALYLIAVRRLGYSVWPFAVLFLYCSHSYLHIAHARDFHTVMLAIPLLLWMMYFMETENRPLFLLFAALTLTVEEGVPPAVTVAGLYLVVCKPHMRAVGWVCAVGAGVYFVAVVGMVMPSLSTYVGVLHWDRYANLGGSFKEALVNLATQPIWALGQAFISNGKWYYLLAFWGSLGFVPLLALKETLLTVLALLPMTLSGYSGQYKLGFHYSATALPFLYYAFVFGMRWALEHLHEGFQRSRAYLRTTIGILAVLVGFNVSQSPGYDLGHVDQTFVASAREVVSSIPKGASVATHGYLVPQLANRHLICFVQWEPGKLCAWGTPEYVILDLDERRYQNIPMVARQNIPTVARQRYMDVLVEKLQYQIVGRSGEIIVLRGPERLSSEFAPSPWTRTFR